MRDALMDQVRQIAADIFKLPLEAITDRSSPETVENWDSLQHVNLVLSLEQDFKVQFLPEEIVEMSSIAHIALLIEKRMAGGEP